MCKDGKDQEIIMQEIIERRMCNIKDAFFWPQCHAEYEVSPQIVVRVRLAW